MKLNSDCVRDILIAIEDSTNFQEAINNNQLETLDVINPYTSEEILYHLRQLSWAGLIQDFDCYADGGYSILDLSPKGHEFLNNIRSDENWNRTKKLASKVGSHSLSALQQIASGVISATINHYLGY
ncbi:hypothetical protein DKZ23_10345 [Limosilactobacillus reuteri]|uniref:DUF2513 domain-containing protein n=1 Tax=Limosilactobacillus reuteri TaxID=1598 RepID=A0A317GFG8_LIMRT|nr:DUF2513 domain-containing protein [Limosilactobacillus reuteri]MCH5385031.1 DUF2513 domain-containing protein [Limosilactobacillus reuteri]PWT44700.1 hypothetical protein DKZ23_10345 [Limosilactobacillus reuteri]PWT50579.1 hypothetical protein DKZ33_06760 [Limosilactobacillus reuteri]PWT61554.1 hypothetical protein DKZ32_07775 [Limosilactobacillus reuteri]